VGTFLKIMAYARLSTRNTSGLHPNLRGMGSLGDVGNPTLTAEAALNQAIKLYAPYHLNPKDFSNSAFLSAAEAEITSAQFAPYAGCTGQAPALNLFQTASGVALGTTAAAVGFLGPSGAALIPAAAVPVIGWVIAGIGAIIGLIEAIFAHHAAAVKRDMNFSCGAVPAVNNAFGVIKTAIQNGTMTLSDAAAALPTIYTQFMAAGGASGSASGPGSIPSGGTAINDNPYCNANCELSVVLYAMVLYWQSQFQAMAAQQEADAQSASETSQGGSVLPGAATSPVASGISAIPAWAWLVGAGLAAWAVL
jgi:hypothetical protein